MGLWVLVSLILQRRSEFGFLNYTAKTLNANSYHYRLPVVFPYNLY